MVRAVVDDIVSCIVYLCICAMFFPFNTRYIYKKTNCFVRQLPSSCYKTHKPCHIVSSFTIVIYHKFCLDIERPQFLWDELIRIWATIMMIIYHHDSFLYTQSICVAIVLSKCTRLKHIINLYIYNYNLCER